MIRALGLDTDRYGVLRFSLGHRNDEEDFAYVADHLGEILNVLREQDFRQSA